MVAPPVSCGLLRRQVVLEEPSLGPILFVFWFVCLFVVFGVFLGLASFYPIVALAGPRGEICHPKLDGSNNPWSEVGMGKVELYWEGNNKHNDINGFISEKTVNKKFLKQYHGKRG